MTKRERLLALGVGIVVLALLLQLGINRVRAGFKTKTDRLAALMTAVEKKQQTVRDGFKAKDKLAEVTKRSLPSDPERAVAGYREWLNKITQDSGLESHQNVFESTRSEKGLYDSHNFKVSGKGTLPEFVKLLYSFFEKDYLHRVKAIKMSPERGETYLMGFVMDVEVLGLKQASATQPALTEPSKRVSLSLAEYDDRICSRNLFAPANSAPKLQKSVSVQVAKDSSLDFQAGATDPDAGQTIQYELDGEAPEGLSIDKASGKLVWLPRELGEYEVTLLAKDNGIPARQSRQTVSIKVIEPPPPVKTEEAPKFDVASQSFVNAFLTGVKGQPEVWIRSKTEDKTLQLKIGDELKLGGVVGKVTAIGATYAEFETDGKRWIVGMDESLADAYKRVEID
jgi:hypothetical protein